MSRFKPTLAGAAAAALLLAAPAATAFAAKPTEPHGKSGTHSSHGKSHSHFTANGKVTAVDGDSFTFHAKGGSKDLHGSDVNVAVTDATKMRRNGVKAAASDLQVGDRVNVVGSRAEDGSLTARHVNAHGAASDDSADATDGDTTDSGSTDPETTDSGTTDSTGTDTGTTGTDSTGDAAGTTTAG